MSKSKIIKDSIIEIENIKEEAKLLAKEEILNEVQESIEQRTKQLFEEKLKSLEESEELDEEFTTSEININEEDCGCDDKNEKPLEEKINKEKTDLKNKMKKNKLNLKEEEISLDEMFHDDMNEGENDDIDIEALHQSGEISDEAYNLWKQTYGDKNNNNNMQEIDETWDENSLMEFLNELDMEDETEEIPSDEEDMEGDVENIEGEELPSEDELDTEEIPSDEEDMEMDDEEFDFDDIEFDIEDDMEGEDFSDEDMEMDDEEFDFDEEEDELEDMDNIDDMDFDSEEEDLEDMDNIEGEEEVEEIDDLEEALAYPHQLHKNVGGKSFPQRDGAPERRSNMNEDIKRLKKLVESVVNENKTLKSKVQKTEALEALLQETKNKLYDTMVLAQKTVYANKVLFENTLTNDEKAEVMKAFSKAGSKDEIVSLNESFNSKFNGTKRTLNTSISKVISTSKGVLKEHTISDEDSNTSRMKNLINYKPKK